MTKKAKDLKLGPTQKLHTKRAKQKIKCSVCEQHQANPIMAYQQMNTLAAAEKAFVHAFDMVQKHMRTEATRKNLAILSVFTTFRSQLVVEGANVYAVVEADYITQPMRVSDDARLVAS